jgi:hypothetical protein
MNMAMHETMNRATDGVARRCVLCLACLLVACAGCYSFRGGSPPAGVRTVTIPPSDDVSGFGRGTIRQDLTQLLTRKFRDDNSLRVVDASSADSRLETSIAGIRSERRNVSGNELETTRDITIDVKVTFDDNIKHRPIFKDRIFTGRSQFDIGQGAAGEDRAIRDALDQVTDEILLATVANW